MREGRLARSEQHRFLHKRNRSVTEDCKWKHPHIKHGPVLKAAIQRPTEVKPLKQKRRSSRVPNVTESVSYDAILCQMRCQCPVSSETGNVPFTKINLGDNVV